MKPANKNRPTNKDAVDHFSKVAGKLEIDNDIWSIFNQYLQCIRPPQDITLRDIERLSGLILTTPAYYFDDSDEYLIFAGLLVMQLVKPNWINDAREGHLNYDQVQNLFGRGCKIANDPFAEKVSWCWQACLDPSRVSAKGRAALGEKFFNETSPTLISNIIVQSLDAFELPN